MKASRSKWLLVDFPSCLWLRHGFSTLRRGQSWPLALILVLTMAIGAGALIATLARGFDLLYTGGAYG